MKRIFYNKNYLCFQTLNFILILSFILFINEKLFFKKIGKMAEKAI